MEPANRNDIDILLRSLARRDGVVSGRLNADDAAVEHLDADELNAFAEGVVTERARARYSAHLAECSNCRGIVVSLTQSAGITASVSPTKDKTSVSLWQQLAAVFSQPVLRFVIPAIVLASIIGIGVIVLRQDQPGEFVAQHEPSQAPISAPANQPVPSQSPSPTESTVKVAPASAPDAVATPAAPRVVESGGKIAGVGTSDGPITLRKESPAKASEATPTFAPDVAASAPPAPAPAYADRRSQTVARDEIARREAKVGEVAAARPKPDDSDDDRNKAATGTRPMSNQAKQRNVQGLMRQDRPHEEKDKSDTTERSESRTVSGKRFNRQNNSWVDVAYQQSRGTTNVKRGSEQYRALIADEPGLRTFAEQLGGEVIVVWKGRAYRFH